MVEKEKHPVENVGMVPGVTLIDEALKRDEKNRVTDKYSFGDNVIDEYMGGGWGRHDAYEMICVFGGTGMNKSTLVSQMMISPARRGDSVAYLALEDEAIDVVSRIRKQMNPTGIQSQKDFMTVMQNIHFMDENDGYSLNAMVETIEELFKVYDVVMIDPIQFMFESSVIERGETEYDRQRKFLKRLRDVVVKAKKPLVFVSHTNKNAYNKNSNVEGLGQVMGSGQLSQICTKVIQINRDKDGHRSVQLLKTRFTKERYDPLAVSLDTTSLRVYFDRTGLEQKQINDMIARW